MCADQILTLLTRLLAFAIQTFQQSDQHEENRAPRPRLRRCREFTDANREHKVDVGSWHNVNCLLFMSLVDLLLNCNIYLVNGKVYRNFAAGLKSRFLFHFVFRGSCATSQFASSGRKKINLMLA